MTQRKILDQDLSNNGNGILTMSQSQVNEAMDELGATKEIRDTFKKAEQKLLGEAVKAAGAEVCEKPEIGKAQIRIGHGDGRTKVSVTGRKEINAPDPHTGETVPRIDYGRVNINERRQLPRDTRDEILAEIEKDCESVFSKR